MLPIVIVGVLMYPETSYADECDCPAWSTESAFADYDAVFVGKVVATEAVEVRPIDCHYPSDLEGEDMWPECDLSPYYEPRHEVVMEYSFKGPVHETVKVWVGGGYCTEDRVIWRGFFRSILREGVTYLFYVDVDSPRPDHLDVNMSECNPTRPIAEAEAHLIELDRITSGERRTPEPTLPKTGGCTPSLGVELTTIVLLAGLIGIGAALVRRPRRR